MMKTSCTNHKVIRPSRHSTSYIHLTRRNSRTVNSTEQTECQIHESNECLVKLTTVRISAGVLDMDKALILSLFLCQEPYGIIEVVKISSSKKVSVLCANTKPSNCGTYSSAAVLILHSSSTWLRSSSRSHSRFLLQDKGLSSITTLEQSKWIETLTWNYTLKVHQQYNDVTITVLPPARNNIIISHLLTSRAIFSSVNIVTFVSSFDLVPENKQRKSVSSITYPCV